jgi:hypothetical protein
MRIYHPHFLLSSLALFLLTGSVHAGVTFTATTRSEGSGFNIGRAANSTVMGWAQGNDGKMEYLGNPGDSIAKGSVILTKDGGESARFYDTVRKMCTPWTGNAVVIGTSSNKSVPFKTVEGLKIQKVSDEAGPEIAGHATRHYVFKVTYDSSFSTSDKTQSSQTELVEELWTTSELAEPALRIWLDQGTWRSGNAETDSEIAATLSGAAGVPLKRISTLSVTNEGGRDLKTKITLEVNTVETAEIPKSAFKEPFRCVADTPKN